MTSIDFRINIIDEATRTMNNIQNMTNRSLQNMTQAQRTYTQSIQNTQRAVLTLQREYVNASRIRQQEIQREIQALRILQAQQRQALSQSNRPSPIGRSTNNGSQIGGMIGGGMFAMGPAGAAAAILSRGTAEALEFAKSVVQVRSEFAKLEAQLQVSTGSRNLAAQYFREIKKTAAETPFEVQDLTELFVRLSNRISGLKFDKSQMIALSDIASSIGKPMEFLTGAIIDATDKARWRNLGITMKKEGDNMILNYKGIQQRVKATTEGALEAMTAFGNLNGVAGMSAQVMETIAGKTSNLSDQWTNLKDNIGKRFEEEIKGSIGAISDLVGWFTQLTEVPLSEELEMDKIQMNSLAEAAMDSNNTSEQRLYLLTQLKNEYPDYFSKLDVEKAKYDDIKAALELANFELNRNIELKRESELQDKKVAKFNEESEDQKRLQEMSNYITQFSNATTFEQRGRISEAFHARTTLWESLTMNLNPLISDIGLVRIKKDIDAKLAQSRDVVSNLNMTAPEMENLTTEREGFKAKPENIIPSKPIKAKTQVQIMKEEFKQEQESLKLKAKLNSQSVTELSQSRNIRQINLSISKLVGIENYNSTTETKDQQVVADNIVKLLSKQVTDVTTNKL